MTRFLHRIYGVVFKDGVFTNHPDGGPLPEVGVIVPRWQVYECANCGDVHQPGVECYCGCRRWERGALVDAWQSRGPLR
jgi:hypothetical protein